VRASRLTRPARPGPTGVDHPCGSRQGCRSAASHALIPVAVELRNNDLIRRPMGVRQLSAAVPRTIRPAVT
jgi:hypothetical protein